LIDDDLLLIKLWTVDKKTVKKKEKERKKKELCHCCCTGYFNSNEILHEVLSVIISPTMRFCMKILSVKISPAYVSFWTQTKYILAWHFLDKESTVELNYN
jgi:hypothetical protein